MEFEPTAAAVASLFSHRVAIYRRLAARPDREAGSISLLSLAIAVPTAAARRRWRATLVWRSTLHLNQAGTGL